MPHSQLLIQNTEADDIREYRKITAKRKLCLKRKCQNIL